MPRHDSQWSRNDRNVESLLRALQEKSESAHKSKLMPFAPGSIDPRALAQQVETRSSAIVAHELKKFILAQLTMPVCTAYLAPLREWLLVNEPLDIFSLNYDTVVEQFCKSDGIPCTDGFSQRGEWQPDLYYRADSGVRLWKLHGSVNWTSSESGWPHRAETPGSWRRHFPFPSHSLSDGGSCACLACGYEAPRKSIISPSFCVPKQAGNLPAARGRWLSFLPTSTSAPR
jgi:hypothetical protein